MKNYKVFLVPEGYTPLLVPNDGTPSNGNVAPTAIETTPSHGPTAMPAPQSMEAPEIKPDEPKPKKIPRPKNSFMTYRADKQPEVLKQYIGASSKDVSRVIADMWAAEPPGVKEIYQKRAEQGRLEHKAKYPDYKYAPSKPRRKDSVTGGGVGKRKGKLAGRGARSAPGSRSGSPLTSPLPSPMGSPRLGAQTQLSMQLGDRLRNNFRLDTDASYSDHSYPNSPTISSAYNSQPASPTQGHFFPPSMTMSAPVSAQSSAPTSPRLRPLTGTHMLQARYGGNGGGYGQGQDWMGSYGGGMPEMDLSNDYGYGRRQSGSNANYGGSNSSGGYGSGHNNFEGMDSGRLGRVAGGTRRYSSGSPGYYSAPPGQTSYGNMSLPNQHGGVDAHALAAAIANLADVEEEDEMMEGVEHTPMMSGHDSGGPGSLSNEGMMDSAAPGSLGRQVISVEELDMVAKRLSDYTGEGGSGGFGMEGGSGSRGYHSQPGSGTQSPRHGFMSSGDGRRMSYGGPSGEGKYVTFQDPNTVDGRSQRRMGPPDPGRTAGAYGHYSEGLGNQQQLGLQGRHATSQQQQQQQYYGSHTSPQQPQRTQHMHQQLSPQRPRIETRMYNSYSAPESGTQSPSGMMSPTGGNSSGTMFADQYGGHPRSQQSLSHGGLSQHHQSHHHQQQQQNHQQYAMTQSPSFYSSLSSSYDNHNIPTSGEQTPHLVDSMSAETSRASSITNPDMSQGVYRGGMGNVYGSLKEGRGEDMDMLTNSMHHMQSDDGRQGQGQEQQGGILGGRGEWGGFDGQGGEDGNGGGGYRW
ncbi:hypothetical protein HDV00_012644 [Rhizophlyctis rosea]|nr:hypothetical protein HDV00_012644 [Rhizophlyctis rosea]